MPGFGCNSDIFDKLDLPSGHIIKLGWITPLKKEAIQSYAERLITPEMRSAKELILIGHSFGGVVVQEMARFIPNAKVILISSVTSKKSLPNGLHLVRNLRLDIWVHKFTMKGTFWIWGKNAGLSGEMKPIFKASMKDYENRYFRWAVKHLAGWKQSPQNDLTPILIHGTKDTVFPIKKAKNPIIIEDGCHLMVYFKAEEVSKVLSDIIVKKAIQLT
jgi:pimeloyl-ACP methyl ester carboxylesterase